jgi:hypothetical protein
VRPEIKVLFVMGHGGSGSTLLGNLLGELDGFFHPGELRTLWRVGLQGLRHCGCQRLVSECPFWSSVLRRGFGGDFSPERVDRVAMSIQELTRFWNVFRLLRFERGRPTGWPALDAYIPVAQRLYRAAADTAGVRVLVDTSKRPIDAAILRLLPGADPYVVELIRDPRAVAYSWRRDRGQPAVRTTQRWTSLVLASWMVRRRYGSGRSLLLRYEDLVVEPRRTIAALAALIGEAPSTIAVTEEGTVHLSPNHTISGHVSRLNAGEVKLRENPEWRRRQSLADRLVVTASTLPLLLRHRYPLVV